MKRKIFNPNVSYVKSILNDAWAVGMPMVSTFYSSPFFRILFWLHRQIDQHTIWDNCVFILFDGWNFINYVDQRPRHKRLKIIRFSIRIIICRFLQLTLIETLIHWNVSNYSKTIKYYLCILLRVRVPNTEIRVFYEHLCTKISVTKLKRYCWIF